MEELMKKSNIKKNCESDNLDLLAKYFNKWKMFVADNSKLNDFIRNIKSHQLNSSATIKTKTQIKKCASPNNYKNRYQAQKNIINNQKNKIEEQSKLINELKIGIIREDLLRSIESTKFEIREIFANCSNQLMRQVAITLPTEEKEKIMLESQKAPKFIQKMNERAIERAKNRATILERKRIIEEVRQRLLEETIEKKRILEEEERKRNLRILNEQRKKEFEAQKLRYERQKLFESKLKTAINFYENLLIKQCFRKIFMHWKRSREKWMLAVYFNDRKKLLKPFKCWLKYVSGIYEHKYEKAESLWKNKIYFRYFKKWQNFQLNRRKLLKLAENVSAHQILKNTFIQWHRFVCTQIMIKNKKLIIAENHALRRILFRCFYQWKSLPVILQLEQAQEERKRKWREKVWEILPDYQPHRNYDP